MIKLSLNVIAIKLSTNETYYPKLVFNHLCFENSKDINDQVEFQEPFIKKDRWIVKVNNDEIVERRVRPENNDFNNTIMIEDEEDELTVYINAIERMLLDPDYITPSDTLKGILANIKKYNNITENQKRAVDNIEEGFAQRTISSKDEYDVY